jgi:hypothetical protein
LGLLQRGHDWVAMLAALWWPRRSRFRDFDIFRFGTAI